MGIAVRERELGRTARFFYRQVLGVETPTRAREALWGYFFAVPWLLGLVIFIAGPIVASAILSLTHYNILKPPQLIGITNYRTAFLRDDLFWPSLKRTFEYAVIVVPVGIVGSLMLAIALNQKLIGTNVFRTLFFIPHLTPAVAMAILWKWILHPEVGPLNYILKNLGWSNPPGWMSSTAWAIPSLILISTWAGLGGNRMLIFLAGLQGVPQEMYEAAEIDGAGALARFRHVTLPMISPTMLFNLILGVIGALKVFTMAFVATGGGPAWATWFYALHLYRNSFQYFKMGYGCALAWIFAALLMALTYIQLRFSRHWVFYAGGE